MIVVAVIAIVAILIAYVLVPALQEERIDLESGQAYYEGSSGTRGLFNPKNYTPRGRRLLFAFLVCEIVGFAAFSVLLISHVGS